MTDKKGRLEAAIAKEIADRPPVALWRHFPVDDQDPVALAEATMSFQREFDFDFIKVTPASSFCLLDWGIEDLWRGNPEGTRDYTRRVIVEPQDWRKLRALDPNEGKLADQLRCLEHIRSGTGGQVPFIQTVFSPLAQAKNLSGSDRLLEHLHRSPEDVQAGLETIKVSTVAFVNEARRRGIAGVFYAIQHASYRLFDEGSYARFGEAYDRQILEAAEGLWLNVLHLHGEAIMFDLAERLPAHLVNWHDRQVKPSLAEGAKRVAGAVCGGLKQWETMVLGDPELVRREAREALGELDGRGVVLGTGCVVPIVAPRANLIAARAVVEG